MRNFSFLSILFLFTILLPTSAQENYGYSKYFGTWVYENQDTIFTVQFQTITKLTGKNNDNYEKYERIVGNYKLEVKGNIIYDFLKPIPSIIDERGKEYKDPSFYGYYFFGSLKIREQENSGNLLYLLDPIKKHNNGEPILALWLKLLPNGNLKWTLEDYESIRRRFLYTDNNGIPVGYSMPTHAIFRKVK